MQRTATLSTTTPVTIRKTTTNTRRNTETVINLLFSSGSLIYGKIFTIIVENIENSVIYTSSSQIVCVVCIRHVWCMRRRVTERCAFKFVLL